MKTEIKLSYNKPTVKLVGNNSNAYAVLGNVMKEMKRAGATPDEVKSFQNEATSGDYNHLLQTCMIYVNVR